jgi:hypothetical protein
MPILLGTAFGRAPTDFDDAPRHLIVVAIDSAAPFPDALRQHGVYFDHLYATGAGRSRMLEAVLHGMPPLPGPPRNTAFLSACRRCHVLTGLDFDDFVTQPT